MPMSRPPLLILVAALALLAAGASPGAPVRPYAMTEEREACTDFNPLRTAYYGDLHVHTAFSQDASTQGTRNTPRDAYRFARGEALGIQPYSGGLPLRRLQLRRPLDFAAVTDHAELLGEVQICSTPGLPGYDSILCKINRTWPRISFFIMNMNSSMKNPTRFAFCGENGEGCLEAALTPWTETQAAAEAAYDRSASCEFTSFVGYEWTGSVDTNNLHRNVIFRNERVPLLPPSFYEAPYAEKLWRMLRELCVDADTGCELTVIPHNSNLSNGLIFETVTEAGDPIDEAWARDRSEIERLVEVMQHKGDSECLPAASPADEFCGFEKLPYQNFAAANIRLLSEDPDPRGFIRAALKEGLVQEKKLGVNPHRFGLIASTDTHLGTPGAVREDEYLGHGGAGVPATAQVPDGLPDNIEFNPGGLAGIWAEENSRDSLFAAMYRREVFGTSGPRLSVRFFGGWDFDADLCESGGFAQTGYDRGVPMGGELPAPPGPEAVPRFAVWGSRDPGVAGSAGTPLQRLQIVKGWLKGGVARERVYEVAGNPHNGASVDPVTCEPRGAGADQLCTVWSDPDFDPETRAFYYARVVENPTCRWSTLQCNAAGFDCADPDAVPEAFAPCCADDHEKTIQERAWSSPIWFGPES